MLRTPPFLGVQALCKVFTTVVSISLLVLFSRLSLTGVIPFETLRADFEKDILELF